MTRRQLTISASLAAPAWAATAKQDVQLLRVPQTGIQPQAALDHHGNLHLV